MKSPLNCILLIDDDEATNYMNTMLLEKANCMHRIEVAESGQQALAYLANCSGGEKDAKFPELIFLDINMPAMNGWEFLDKYRELSQPAITKPVIIMLSTSINPDDKVHSQRIGLIDAFESKPLNPQMIERILERHFKQEAL